MTGAPKAAWQRLPQSAVSFPRQRVVRDAVSAAAKLLAIPAPDVVIAPTKSAVRTGATPLLAIRMDSYLVANAPEPVVQALVALEMSHLVAYEPNDRRSRTLQAFGKLTAFLAVALWFGGIWAGTVIGSWHRHNPPLLILSGVFVLSWSLRIARRRMLRPRERAADAASVQLVGTEAFVAARHWVAEHYYPRNQSHLWRWFKEVANPHPPMAERIAMAEEMALPPGPLLKVLARNKAPDEGRPW